jgi:magnesium transporter
MINIEQNNIIKIFSIAAVVFLPPTLVAFALWHEFRGRARADWALGYPFAILFIVISAVLPYLYFKSKGRCS